MGWHLFMNYQQSKKEMKLKIKFNCEQKVFLGFLLIALVFQNIGQAAAFENELENQEEYPMQSSFEEMNYDSPLTTEELVPITTSEIGNFAFDRLLNRRKTRANIRALAQRLLAARKNYFGNDRKLLPRLY